MRILIAGLLLGTVSCSMLQSADPASIAFSIPEGSTLRLERDLPIDAGNTHAYVQGGATVTENGRNRYEVNCRLDMKQFGPRTLHPETFRIRRTEDGQEWVSYPNIKLFYTEMHLDSDAGTDVIKMTCERWGGRIDSHFPVADMQQQLRGYFSFSFSTGR